MAHVMHHMRMAEFGTCDPRQFGGKIKFDGVNILGQAPPPMIHGKLNGREGMWLVTHITSDNPERPNAKSLKVRHRPPIAPSRA